MVPADTNNKHCDTVVTVDNEGCRTSTLKKHRKRGSKVRFAEKDDEYEYADDDEDILPIQLHKQKKKKTKLSKGWNCCFQTTKYSFKCCRFLLARPCFLLFLLLLIYLTYYCATHNETVKKFIRFLKNMKEEKPKDDDRTFLYDLFDLIG